MSAPKIFEAVTKNRSIGGSKQRSIESFGCQQSKQDCIMSVMFLGAQLTSNDDLVG